MSATDDRDLDRGGAPPKDLSVAGLVREALGEISGLERRLPRTLIALLTRPGSLTDQYRKGHARDYVSPVRLYVVASALYFASAWADDSEGVNLGLVTVTQVMGQMPTSSAPHFILIAAVPLFAVLLSGLFGGGRVWGFAPGTIRPSLRHREDPVPPIGEFLVFALYFQTALLVLIAMLQVTPIADGVRSLISIGFFVGYIGLAARRLWGSWLPVALFKASVAVVLYVLSLGVATGVVMWVETAWRG